MTPAQRHALERHGRRYLVVAEQFDWWQAFARDARRYVEIGFGMGENLLHLAARNPDADYLGIDVYEPGIGRLVGQLAASHIGNVRIVVGDAVDIFRDVLEPETLSGAYIYFPDPWPKKRHHKRRLIQPPFVELLVRSLLMGGVICLATDCEDYALQMKDILNGTPQLRNAEESAGFALRSQSRPATKFERRGTRLGHRVFDLRYVKAGPFDPAGNP